MIGGLLGRLAGWLEGDDEDDTDGSRFVPSPLDASVRHAHGGSGDEITREIGTIQDEARRLDEQRDG